MRLAGGDHLEVEIKRAIEHAGSFIVVLSPNAVNSGWVAREIQHALQVQRKLGAGYRVIPLLLPEIQPSALRLWFEQEPLAVRIGRGPGEVAEALPELLAALGERLPEEREVPSQSAAQPLADLVLELTDPAIDESEGRRRATAHARLVYEPPDGAPKVAGARFPFTAPLGPIEAEELRWYLERYWRWPGGVFRERAERVEELLPGWGRLLYEAVAAAEARTALEAWKAARDAERRFTVLVDHALVAGRDSEQQRQANEAAAKLLALPWELIHDGGGYLFHGANGARVRRRLPNRAPLDPVTAERVIRVLLVSPRPEDEECALLDHRASARPLVEALSRLGELAEFKVLAPPTFPALGEELQNAFDGGQPYHVVHFDGHGVYSRQQGLGALCFEEPADSTELDQRRPARVSADELAAVIRGHRVPLLYLDACQTAAAEWDPSASVAARLLQNGVASVVAMSHSVLVETSRRFVARFYEELMSGRRVGRAMLAGQRDLMGDSFRGRVFTGELRLQDWFVPVLFQEESDLQLVTAVPDGRVQAVIKEQRELGLGELPPAPAHSFVGRGRELLRVERLLQRERYAVLRGQAGEGKSTLAAEAARWLVTTRRFQRAAFVSLEREGEARGVLYSIGRQIMPRDYLLQAGGDDELALQLVERALRERQTLILLDNMESVLPPAPDSEAAGAFDPEVLGEILRLCGRLVRVGATRLVFTSREPLPEPFHRNHLVIGRLERPDAIALVGRVLGERSLMPHAADPGESEEEIRELVEAVGCHARSLVLLAPEVAGAGVRSATGNIAGLIRRLHERYPDDRQRSLIASVELSLGRLETATRRKIRPLAAFQGGGSLATIAPALGLEPAEAARIARQLVVAGLAEWSQYGYLRLDPALGVALSRELSEEENGSARAAWAEAMGGLTRVLYAMKFSDPVAAQNLTLLELPNLLAALELLARTADPESVVDLATMVEGLLANLGRPRALALAARIRTRTGEGLAWGHARSEAGRAAVERLLDQGHLDEAVAAAEALLRRAHAAGEEAYPEAPFDLALALRTLGRSLMMNGHAEAALQHLGSARHRFLLLATAGDRSAAQAASVVLTDSGDCYRALGRLDEAAATYEEAIKEAGEWEDPRQVAVGKFQLATVRRRQRRYSQALTGCEEAREIFDRLGEVTNVASAWHEVAEVHRMAGEYEQAEEAFQEALKLRVQAGDRAGEGRALGDLGSLCRVMSRHEQAVPLHRQAADVFSRLGDLLNEGVARNNAAISLLKLKRYDETRAELERAVECLEPRGNAARPWLAFALLHDLEVATGNQAAAEEARHRAVELYLGYLRAGGLSQTRGGRLCQKVAGAVRSGQAGNAAAELTQLLRQPGLSEPAKTFLMALQAVLAGSRDPALADDPQLDYAAAGELRWLVEALQAEG
jgi:tetratricopeptide (TPR) repeat protein